MGLKESLNQDCLDYSNIRKIEHLFVFHNNKNENPKYRYKLNELFTFNNFLSYRDNDNLLDFESRDFMFYDNNPGFHESVRILIALCVMHREGSPHCLDILELFKFGDIPKVLRHMRIQISINYKKHTVNYIYGKEEIKKLQELCSLNLNDLFRLWTRIKA